MVINFQDGGKVLDRRGKNFKESCIVQYVDVFVKNQSINTGEEFVYPLLMNLVN